MRSLRLGLVGLLVGVGLVVGPSGGVAPAAESPRIHLALGDSVATGYGASEGYVQRFFAFLRARGSVDSLRNLARDGETSGSFLSDQLPRAFEVVADPATDVTVVTLDIGGNDGLRNGSCIFPNAGDSCRATLGRFAINYGTALDRLSEALASDPGVERLLVMTYYNPWSGTGREMEPVVDHTLLGDDGKLDCSAGGADLGGNDLIACIGARHGADVADVYPALKGRGLELIADGIHPNDAGHALIAAEFERVWIAGLADDAPPVLTLPAPIRVEASGPAGATVTYAVSAVDDIDPAPLVSCQPPSGATFPVGTTTVRCTARDASGNTTVGSFEVFVPRPPGPLRCGDTITDDTRLRRDLTNCRTDGLAIGADNITLDLNGHVIDGNSVSSPSGLGDYGIDNSGGRDGVTVKGGRVRDFDHGIVLGGDPDGGADHNRLLRLAVSNTFTGLRLTNAQGNQIRANTFAGNETAIALHRGSDGNVVKGNRVVKQGGDILLESSNANLVRQNALANEGSWAINLTRAHQNRLVANRVTGDGSIAIGIQLRNSDDNEIRKNVVSDTNFSGISLAFSQGGSDGNRLEANSVTRARNSEFGNGILVSSLALNPSTARPNVLVNNRAFDNAGDGIRVVDGLVLVVRNLATANGDDGIESLDGEDDANETTLVANTANHNADLGIEARSGVTDGGGNRARGNGNPLQCLNVFCG